jgi:hypothetical protein
MRADPEHRRPAPPGRRADFLPTAARAWGLVLIFVRRSPAMLAGAILAFAAADRVPHALLERAHVGLGGSGDLVQDFGAWGATWILALRAARFALPAVIAAAPLLSMQRMFLARGESPLRSAAWWTCWARLAAALLALKIAGYGAEWLAAELPARLVLLLGPISAILTLILLAPLAVLGALAVLRLSLTPPPMALGLPRALAESWQITRGHGGVMIGAGMIAAAPLALAASAFAWWRPPADTAAALIVVLPLGLFALLLAGGLTSLWYHSYRLPQDLRPDRRPSRNRGRRAEPLLAK